MQKQELMSNLHFIAFVLQTHVVHKDTFGGKEKKMHIY